MAVALALDVLEAADLEAAQAHAPALRVVDLHAGKAQPRRRGAEELHRRVDARAGASAMPERSVSRRRSNVATRFEWSIRCSPSRLSRFDACFAIQIDVETPIEAVTHSPISSLIARLTARATPSGPSFFRFGVPARSSDASSIDIRSTSGLCVRRISMSLSDTAR